MAIALSTLLFLAGRGLFAKGQWALLYLLVILLVAGAAGTRVYVVVLTALEERDRHRHTLANAQAHCARTQSQLSAHEACGPLPMLAGHAGA